MQAETQPTAGRSRRNRKRGQPRPPVQSSPVWPGISGGAFHPLPEAALQRMHTGILSVLENTGMSEAPPIVVDALVAKGAQLNSKGRLLFPRSLVEDAIAAFRRDFVLHGQTPGHDLEMTPTKVHVGSGGAAPSVIDLKTNLYRDGTLKDLYDAARIVDALENIHFFSRSIVARDIEDPLEFDVNTAFACLTGTAKHVMVAASEPDHVDAIAQMCAIVAGNEKQYAERPFLSMNINHVVAPMRFMPEACGVMARCAQLDIPIFANSFDQAGASSPASLAGSVLQACAETLAGMLFCWAINPNCRLVFGPRPLITDLRTGALTGGCGEQAVAGAAASQMALFYKLPSSCIAGASDAKLPDVQSGYEKCLTVSLAAHAGCNVITQAAGMQATMMGCGFESYVIDNDMLGGILRSIRGIDVAEANFSETVIDEAVNGDGHFLSHMDTMARMETEYLYPNIADRLTVDEWIAKGSPDIVSVAKQRAEKILSEHYPSHLSSATLAALRGDFVIRLSADQMGAG